MEQHMEETPGKRFFDRQIALLAEQDIDGIANQYAPDAVLVSFDVTRHGREEIREHFVGYLAALGKIDLKSTDKWAETDDSIFFEATVLTAHGEAHVYDVFLLRGGKATHHYTGLISFTPFANQ